MMKLQKLLIGTALLASLTLSNIAQAETNQDMLSFKNGDRLSGELIGINDELILFKTRYNAIMHVPLAQIADMKANQQSLEKLDMSDAALTERLNKAMADIKPMDKTPEPADMKAAVEQNVIPAERIEKKADVPQVEEEENGSLVAATLREQLGLETNGFLRFGANLQEGNTEQHGVRFQGEFVTDLDEKNRLTLRGEYNYEEDDDTVTEDNRSGEVIYDYFFAPKWFLTNNLSVETDKEAELDLRTTLGVGLGYQFFKRKDLKLSVSLGPNYLHEEFDTGETNESLAGRWAVDYEQSFFDKRLKAFHDHEILQSFDETDNFQFDSATGISVPITEHFSGVFQIDYDFDNDPAAGTKREDTTYSLNLGYEW